jgi:signal transduction histidine kinase
MGGRDLGSREQADHVAERTRTLQTLLVAGMCVLAVGAISGLLRGGDVWMAVYPYAGMLVEHAMAYGISRTGRLRLAVAVHVTLYLAVRGLLPPASGPDPVRLGVVIAATLVITGAILAVALRIIETARARALEQERARLHLEERLAQTRTLDTVARVAAGVAHDFNNVLTVILALAALLKRSADASPWSAFPRERNG